MGFRFELRNYQTDFCRRTYDAFYLGIDGNAPVDTALSVAATGAGKTIMAAALAYAIIRKRGGRVLFLADTDELVDQARDKMVDAADLIPSIEKGQIQGSRNAKIVVGSIQTMSRAARLETWDFDHFDLVIADEAHLSMAAGWQRVLNHFKNGGAKILGITATPERLDGKNLLSFYQCIPYEITLFDLIEKGHLAPITVQTVPIEIDTSHIENPAGEIDDDQVDHALSPYLDKIIDEWLVHAADRKTLIFHPNIRMSKEFNAKLLQRGIKTAHIDGTTRNRRRLLDEYENGKYQILNNAMLLTKGYDCPDIGCVVILRPTKSRVAYQQMVGRGTRTCIGKTDCLLLDFLYQFEDLGTIRPAALAARGEEVEREMQRQLNEGGTQGKLSLTDVMSKAEAMAKKNLLNQFQKRAGNTGKVYDAGNMLQILGQPQLIDYKPEFRWEQDMPSQAQLETLERVGIDPLTIKSKGQASQILSLITDRRHKRKATPKQVAFLASRGFQNAASMTFTKAKDEINKITGGFGRRGGKPHTGMI